MTAEYPGADNMELINSPADWISPHGSPVKGAPAPNYNYMTSPPVADGKIGIISDTDHLWGVGGTSDWVWKSFFRGLNPIFMDPYQRKWHVDPVNLPNSKSIRRAMGYTRELAERVDLASMKPRIDIASSEYCLAAEGEAYLVYLPVHYQKEQKELVKKTVSVDLSAAAAPLAVEWFNPRTAETILAGTTRGGAIKAFTAPFPGDAVLYLHARK